MKFDRYKLVPSTYLIKLYFKHDDNDETYILNKTGAKLYFKHDDNDETYILNKSGS